MKRACLLAVVLAACGSSSKPPAEPKPEFTGPLAAGQWDGMDKEARAHFMGQVVMPRMKALFQGLDADEFSEFECETCHGSGAVDHTFTMPNPELPQLSQETFANPPPEDEKAVIEFMMTQVRPTMAELLGLPEWSPEHPDGFGCTGCHTMKQ